MSCLMGIDIGTTGIKAIVMNKEGDILGSHTVEQPMSAPHPGWAEQDPEMWWKNTVTAVRGALKKAADVEIAGVGLSGQMHSSVFLDSDLNVIRPALLWCDTRTTIECQWITETAGEENLKKWVANPALEGFTAPKIIWLRNNEPENYDRIARVVLPKDYIRYRLTGDLVMEVSDSAGTLLFDVKKRVWSDDMLRALDIPRDFLTDVIESIEVGGTITSQTAGETGLKAGTPVVGGGADNSASAVGTGIVTEGMSVASIGTSGTFVAYMDEPKVDSQMRAHTFCHSVPGKWYMMGVMLSSGFSLRWFRDQFGETENSMALTSGRDAYDLLADAAQNVEPGSEGLIFLPYLMGERTPHKDANARGVFYGIGQRHTRSHMIRSVFEGIVFGMRDSLEIIRNEQVPVKEIRATGGGGKSEFFLKLQADIYGAPISRLKASEGGVMGAAIMAGVGAGLYKDIIEATDQLVKVEKVVEPDQSKQALYDDMYGLYREIYQDLRECFAKTAKVVAKYRK